MSGIVQNLTFSYGRGKHPALEKLSFEFSQNAVIGLAGPNGSGKSTLLKCLARLLTPSSGTFRWNGEDFFGLPFKTAAQKIGLLPQQPIDPGYWTVAELAAQGRFLYGDISADHPAVEKVLTQLELEGFRDRKVSELSGGERQLAFLSIVLVKQPELLFLDEPDHFLDLKRKQLLSKVLQSEKAERTVVISSHDLNFLAQTCDQVLLLSPGQTALCGAPEQVFAAATLQRVFGVKLAPQVLSNRRLAVLADYNFKSAD